QNCPFLWREMRKRRYPPEYPAEVRKKHVPDLGRIRRWVPPLSHLTPKKRGTWSEYDAINLLHQPESGSHAASHRSVVNVDVLVLIPLLRQLLVGNIMVSLFVKP